MGSGSSKSGAVALQAYEGSKEIIFEALTEVPGAAPLAMVCTKIVDAVLLVYVNKENCNSFKERLKELAAVIVKANKAAKFSKDKLPFLKSLEEKLKEALEFIEGFSKQGWLKSFLLSNYNSNKFNELDAEVTSIVQDMQVGMTAEVLVRVTEYQNEGIQLKAKLRELGNWEIIKNSPAKRKEIFDSLGVSDQVLVQEINNGFDELKSGINNIQSILEQGPHTYILNVDMCRFWKTSFKTEKARNQDFLDYFKEFCKKAAISKEEKGLITDVKLKKLLPKVDKNKDGYINTIELNLAFPPDIPYLKQTEILINNDLLVQVNLPEMNFTFVGRSSEVSKIIKELENNKKAMYITGPPGFGKSTLLVYIGRVLSSKQSQLCLGGVFYTNLENCNSTKLIVSKLNHSTSVPNETDDTEQGLQKIINWLSDISESTLFLIDNVENAIMADHQGFYQVFTQLMKASSNVKFIFSSRIKITTMNNYPLEKIVVETLNENEAIEILNSGGVEVDANISLELCKLCGFAPMAISIVSSLITSGKEPDELLEELKDGEMIEYLSDEGIENSLKQILSSSWKMLNQDNQLVISALTVFIGPFNSEAAAYVLGRKDKVIQTRKILTKLVDNSLLSYDKFNKLYVLHSIIKSFVQEIGNDDQRSVYVDRFIRYYVEQLTNHGIHFNTTPAAALNFYDTQTYNIKFIINAKDTLPTFLRADYLQMAVSACKILQKRLSLMEQIDFFLFCSEIAKNKEYKSNEAVAQCLLIVAYTYYRINDYPSALRISEEAKTFSEKISNLDKARVLMAQYHFVQGMVHLGSHKYQLAASELNVAKDTYHSIGDKKEEGFILSHLGKAYRLLDGSKALICLVQAFQIAEELDDNFLKTSVLNSKGALLTIQEKYEESIEVCRECLTECRKQGVGDYYYETWSLVNIGTNSIRLQRKDDAIKYYKEALTLAKSHSMQRAINVIQFGMSQLMSGNTSAVPLKSLLGGGTDQNSNVSSTSIPNRNMAPDADYLANKQFLDESLEKHCSENNGMKEVLAIPDPALIEFVTNLAPVHSCPLSVLRKILDSGKILATKEQPSGAREKLQNYISKHKLFKESLNKLDLVQPTSRDMLADLCECACIFKNDESTPLRKKMVETCMKNILNVAKSEMAKDEVVRELQQLGQAIAESAKEDGLDLVYPRAAWGQQGLADIGLSKFVWATLGPNTRYGSVSLVLNRDLLRHPDSHMVINGAMVFFTHMTKDLRPWCKLPTLGKAAGDISSKFKRAAKSLIKQTKIFDAVKDSITKSVYERSKLNAAVHGWEETMAWEVSGQAKMALTGKTETKSPILESFQPNHNLAASEVTPTLVKSWYCNVDNPARIECHLPPVIPVSYIDYILVSKEGSNEKDIEDLKTLNLPDGRSVKDMMVVCQDEAESLNFQISYFCESDTAAFHQAEDRKRAEQLAKEAEENRKLEEKRRQEELAKQQEEEDQDYWDYYGSG